MTITGTIRDGGLVEVSDGRTFFLPMRGSDVDNYPEVLIDATLVGGYGCFKRQSIKPYIGMLVEFISTNGVYGYNFVILPNS